jgi:hypothetical protein
MDRDAVEQALRSCLLTDEELSGGPHVWKTYENPIRLDGTVNSETFLSGEHAHEHHHEHVSEVDGHDHSSSAHDCGHGHEKGAEDCHHTHTSDGKNNRHQVQVQDHSHDHGHEDHLDDAATKRHKATAHDP